MAWGNWPRLISGRHRTSSTWRMSDGTQRADLTYRERMKRCDRFWQRPACPRISLRIDRRATLFTILFSRTMLRRLCGRRRRPKLRHRRCLREIRFVILKTAREFQLNFRSFRIKTVINRCIALRHRLPRPRKTLQIGKDLSEKDSRLLRYQSPYPQWGRRPRGRLRCNSQAHQIFRRHHHHLRWW